MPAHLARVAIDEKPELVPGPQPLVSTVLSTGAPLSQFPLASDATPTQVANPRRTTWRSLFQLAVALFTALPQLIPIILGQWDAVWLSSALGQVLIIQGVIVRLMALPGVNNWLLEHVPGLAAIPSREIYTQ